MKNPLTKEAFAEWCEKQPADKVYDYADNFNCPVAQYLYAHGHPNAQVFAGEWRSNIQSTKFRPIPEAIEDALVGRGVWYTFGALAARLRSA